MTKIFIRINDENKAIRITDLDQLKEIVLASQNQEENHDSVDETEKEENDPVNASEHVLPTRTQKESPETKNRFTLSQLTAVNKVPRRTARNIKSEYN